MLSHYAYINIKLMLKTSPSSTGIATPPSKNNIQKSEFSFNENENPIEPEGYLSANKKKFLIGTFSINKINDLSNFNRRPYIFTSLSWWKDAKQ